MRRVWRAVNVDIFTDPLFRGNDELVAWLLIVMRYARAFDDADKGLRRGQFRASLAELTRRFQKSVEQDPARRGNARWTVGKTRAFIARLEKHGALSSARSTDETGRPVTLFTVENYGKWQQTERTPNNKPNADRTANQNAVPIGTSDDYATGRTANRTQTEQRTERTHRETGFLETETKETKHTPSADGGSGSEDFALEGQSSTPEKPTRGVVVNGERWPEREPKDEYPATFLEGIWEVWLRAGAASERVTPGNKAKTYALCRHHISKGATLEELRKASIQYLKPFTAVPTGTNAKHAPTFFAKKEGEWEGHLESQRAADRRATYSRSDFPNLAKLGGYLAIVMRANNVEGAPGRSVPPDDAWRVFQEQPPEIQAQVKAGYSL